MFWAELLPIVVQTQFGTAGIFWWTCMIAYLSTIYHVTMGIVILSRVGTYDNDKLPFGHIYPILTSTYPNDIHWALLLNTRVICFIMFSYRMQFSIQGTICQCRLYQAVNPCTSFRFCTSYNSWNLLCIPVIVYAIKRIPLTNFHSYELTCGCGDSYCATSGINGDWFAEWMDVFQVISIYT